VSIYIETPALVGIDLNQKYIEFPPFPPAPSAAPVVGAFTPASISGLQIWLDATTLGLSGGTAVATWPDLSGNHYDASQATGTKQPIYNTNKINGLPAVTFDGSNDVLVSVIGGILTNFSAFVVIIKTTSRQFNGYVTTAANTNELTLEDKNNAGALDVWDQNVGAQAPTANGVANTGTPLAIGYTYDTATINVYSGNTVQGTTNIASGRLGQRVNIGGNENASFFTMQGSIGELVVYNSNIGSSDRANLFSYFSSKWGTT
jgi:hypothetical protein